MDTVMIMLVCAALFFTVQIARLLREMYKDKALNAWVACGLPLTMLGMWGLLAWAYIFTNNTKFDKPIFVLVIGAFVVGGVACMIGTRESSDERKAD